MSSASVIEQNNKGIAYFNTQDYQNAIDSFSSALIMQKELEAMNCTSLSCMMRDEEDCVDQCMLLREVDEMQASTTTHAFVYEYAITLPPTMQEDSSVVIQILIFNLALATQLKARGASRDVESSASSLSKARRLYELAYKALDSKSNVLFQFAILNNIAVIDRELGNESVSRMTFEYLLSVFMMLVDQGCASHLQHVKGFLANVSCCTMETAAAA